MLAGKASFILIGSRSIVAVPTASATEPTQKQIWAIRFCLTIRRSGWRKALTQSDSRRLVTGPFATQPNIHARECALEPNLRHDRCCMRFIASSFARYRRTLLASCGFRSPIPRRPAAKVGVEAVESARHPDRQQSPKCLGPCGKHANQKIGGWPSKPCRRLRLPPCDDWKR